MTPSNADSITLQLRRLLGRMNYANNQARALRARAERTQDQARRQDLLAQAIKAELRAADAKTERDRIKAEHFGSAHPRFHNEPLQRQKAASAARAEQRRRAQA